MADNKPSSRKTLSLDVEGMDDAKKLLKTLDKDANRRLRQASKKIVNDVAMPAVKSAGAGNSKQSRLAASAIRLKSDRFPAMIAGGTKIVIRHRYRTGTQKVIARDLFFGAEFGGQARKTTMQFRPHRGRHGYWFWPAIRSEQPEIGSLWIWALDGVVNNLAGSDG